MSRLTIYLPDDVDRAFKQACDDKDVSYSTACRELIVREIRTGDMFDAIPDELVELAEKEARQQEIMAQQKLREKKASFDDRIQGFFRKRLEGDSAYRPEDMEELAKGYRADARNWFEDPDRIAEAERKVDKWMNQYRAGYEARQQAERPDTEIDDSGDWFQVGQDLDELRTQQRNLLKTIKRHVERDGIDPDSILDSVAGEFSVDSVAVEILLTQIDPDRTTHEMLVSDTGAIDSINNRLSQLRDRDRDQSELTGAEI